MTPPQPHARPRSWSLATRLTAWYACSAFALILVATVFLYRTMAKNLYQEEDLFLADNIQDVRQVLTTRPDDMQLEEEVAQSNRYVKIYKRLLTEGGQVIIETPGMADLLDPRLFPPPIRTEDDLDHGKSVVASNRRSFRIAAAHAATTWPGRGTCVVQVALSQAKAKGLLTKYRRRLWHMLGLALAACVIIGYHIARRGMRPIGDISRAAQRVGSTTLDQRIPMTKLPAELLTLAHIFNDMLARLQDSFDRLSHFSADIAHELRTPVNNVRGMAEVTLRGARSTEEYRDALESCLEECVRLSRLIDSLLFLARAEQTHLAIQRAPLDVADELRTVREFYEAAATDVGVALTLSAAPHLIVDLDRTLFQRAVGNLITNALAYTRHGGSVAMNASKRQGAVCVEVADTGCGIPAEQLPHVFDRFYRAHAAGAKPKGMGLGLAIVKSIVMLHGGSVAIASDLGRGTTVTMTFPAR